MSKMDKQELIIDALMHTLTVFQEAGYEGTDEYKVIQKIADDLFHVWVENHSKH